MDWSDRLPALPLLVLLRMALTAPDDREPGEAWLGRGTLLEAMGRRAPHSPADHRALARVIDQLEHSGAITRTRRARPGMTAKYRINVAPRARRDGAPEGGLE